MSEFKLYRRRLIRLIRKNNIFIMVVMVVILLCYTFTVTSKPLRHHRKYHQRLVKGHHSHHANNPDDLLDGMVPEHLDHHDVIDNDPLPGEFNPEEFKKGHGFAKKDWLGNWPRADYKDKGKKNGEKKLDHKKDLEIPMSGPKSLKFSKKKRKPEKVVLYRGESDKGIEVDKEILIESVNFPPFKSYGRPGDPGEMGMKYKLNMDYFSDDDAKQKEEDFKIHFFDEWVSQRIAVHRTLQDARPESCRYQDTSRLSPASVIIVFHNEAWTVLLRTLHSILDRTPPELLQEIILMDDDSDMEHLGLPLQGYVQRIKKIRLIRAPGRLGLIRARNVGVEYARADTVVFLDSHIECFEGWLEPLLLAVHTDKKTLAYPMIEFISASTFGLRMSSQPQVVGGFYSHTLSFSWLYKRRLNVTTKAENHPSPTMPGGLYAISKDWFNELGGYDPGLKLWGAENMEMSFKAWMCGGQIVLASCSHVGHIFRTRNPTLEPGVSVMENAIRVAEVWMDEYKHFFYERMGYNLGNYGDVRARKRLRRHLQCHSFGWYLDNVYPEMKEDMHPDTVYGGRIVHYKTGLCLERAGKVVLTHCKGYVFVQMWQVTMGGEIQSRDKVLGVASFTRKDEKTVNLVRISDKSFVSSNFDACWKYDGKSRIYHPKSDMCLAPGGKIAELKMEPCTNDPSQKWTIDKRKDMQAAVRREGNVNIDWDV